MIVSQSQQNNENNPANPLIPLPAFKKSGRCPLEPYHLLFHHKESLVEYGAFITWRERFSPFLVILLMKNIWLTIMSG